MCYFSTQNVSTSPVLVSGPVPCRDSSRTICWVGVSLETPGPKSFSHPAAGPPGGRPGAVIRTRPFLDLVEPFGSPSVEPPLRLALASSGSGRLSLRLADLLSCAVGTPLVLPYINITTDKAPGLNSALQRPPLWWKCSLQQSAPHKNGFHHT